MLVHYRELFEKDFSGEYAIPAFNVHNLEVTLGVVRAAVAKKAPVILEAAAHSISYAGVKNLQTIVASVANDPSVTVPVALHLDHTEDFATIQSAIEAGFSSVMIDASRLPIEENMAKTKEVVRYAHEREVWVQSELGRLRGSEDWVSVGEAEELFTDPEEAERFARETNIDALAIAVGTLHGIIKFREKIVPKLDIERIADINSRVRVPLVLHGASGVARDQLREAIKAGIQIVNVDTELRIAFTSAVRKVLEDPSEVDPRKILGPAIDAVQRAAELKLDQLGASGKAG